MTAVGYQQKLDAAAAPVDVAAAVDVEVAVDAAAADDVAVVVAADVVAAAAASPLSAVDLKSTNLKASVIFYLGISSNPTIAT